MMKLGIMAAVALSGLWLAACDTGGAPPDARDAATEGEAIEATGSGVVTAVDAGGTVTIAHGDMPELGWPPMTMAFAAPPELLSGVAPGDEVTFELSVEGGRGRITALARR